jgi:hypothetical protein
LPQQSCTAAVHCYKVRHSCKSLAPSLASCLLSLP